MLDVVSCEVSLLLSPLSLYPSTGITALIAVF